MDEMKWGVTKQRAYSWCAHTVTPVLEMKASTNDIRLKTPIRVSNLSLVTTKGVNRIARCSENRQPKLSSSAITLILL